MKNRLEQEYPCTGSAMRLHIAPFQQTQRMANNPEKSPKANVFGTAAKQAKAAPKAAKEKTVNVEASKQASPDERTPTADKPSLKIHSKAKRKAPRPEGYPS
jgi:hypothetical protein